MSADITNKLADQVKEAAERGAPLVIQGGGSKSFYGRLPEGQLLETRGHQGIVNYQATELVVTVRAGTSLLELEQALAEQDQVLAFEPPHFADTATIGGTVACALAGPARPYRGAVKDFVLGVSIINGNGEIQRFGGEVMKNVAGYDVSRLMTGSLGTLGVLLEVSLKVLPRPREEITLVHSLSEVEAIGWFNHLAAKPYPLSGACYINERAYIRLSGSASGIQSARSKIGGDKVPNSEAFWHKLREHSHHFFDQDGPLWRLSLPPTTTGLDLPGSHLVDWGGAQRWLISTASVDDVRERVTALGGHVTRFRGSDRTGQVFHPLSPAMQVIQHRLKRAFDPIGILNRGRMYPEW
jgi:glycolate oxidase FAD binding subunit